MMHGPMNVKFISAVTDLLLLSARHGLNLLVYIQQNATNPTHRELDSCQINVYSRLSDVICYAVAHIFV
jgi:hypothetical protein